MLEEIEIKHQTLKDFLQVDFNKGVYNFNHQYLKPTFGFEIKNILNFFNSIYKISATFFYNYEELPYETNNHIVNLCINVSDDELVEKAILMTVFYELNIYLTGQIIKKENGQKEAVDSEYILAGKKWTYYKQIVSLQEKASKQLSYQNNETFETLLDKLCKYVVSDYNINALKIEKLKEYFTSITKSKTTNQSNQTNIKFKISPTETVELVKSMIENGNVKGTQKEIINAFSNFFNIEIKYPSKLINDIKNTRNTGSETLFLDKLKTSLLDYLQK